MDTTIHIHYMFYFVSLYLYSQILDINLTTNGFLCKKIQRSKKCCQDQGGLWRPNLDGATEFGAPTGGSCPVNGCGLWRRGEADGFLMFFVG